MKCVLCGTACVLEMRPTAVVQAQVAARYKEGPFAWKTLQHAKAGRDSFCAHCLNHIRKRKKTKVRGYLPMDQFLLGLLCPGHVPELDLRCHRRLWQCMLQTSNPYRHTGVQPLEALIQKKGSILTWWTQNLETMFFRDKQTASMVRRAIEIKGTAAAQE